MKWTCSICGYTHEGDTPPAKCPQCGVPAEKFNKVEEGEREWAAEHVVGVAQGVDEEIVQGPEKAILKSASTGKRLLSKKQNTLLSSQNCLAKS